MNMERIIKVTLASLMAMGLLFSYIGSTAGSFTDTEESTDNTLRCWVSASTGMTYAIAYTNYTGSAYVGFLKTVHIATDGQITDTVIDTLEFDSSNGQYPNIINISGNIHAIAYTGDPDDGFLKTVEIATDGQITDTIIDTLEFDGSAGLTPNIIHVSGDVYAIAYSGTGNNGLLKTVEIATNGQITDTIIDTLEFDTNNGTYPNIIFVSDAP